MKLLFLFAVSAVIALAAAFAPVANRTPDAVSLDRIQTDASQTFEFDAQIARAWFVEAVLPSGS